jgi:hypothetical protein
LSVCKDVNRKALSEEAKLSWPPGKLKTSLGNKTYTVYS